MASRTVSRIGVIMFNISTDTVQILQCNIIDLKAEIFKSRTDIGKIDGLMACSYEMQSPLPIGHWLVTCTQNVFRRSVWNLADKHLFRK